MNTTEKRERLKAVVLEQEQLRTEIERLTARSAELDAELDRLLSSPAPGAKRAADATTPSLAKTPATVPTAGEGKQRRGRRRRNATKQPVTAAKAPTTKRAGGKTAPRGKAKATVKAARSGNGEPTLKQKILAALRDQPDGVDLATVAKQAYGSDDKDARRKCEQNLYNMAKQKLVRHDGPKWQVVAAA